MGRHIYPVGIDFELINDVPPAELKNRANKTIHITIEGARRNLPIIRVGNDLVIAAWDCNKEQDLRIAALLIVFALEEDTWKLAMPLFYCDELSDAEIKGKKLLAFLTEFRQARQKNH